MDTILLGEVIAALKILQSGDISRQAMKSSWGGAMGQPRQGSIRSRQI